MTPGNSFGAASGGSHTGPAASSFSFGNATPSSSSMGSLGFGGATKESSTSQPFQSAGGPSSVFGKTSAPSTFSFGTPAASSSSSPGNNATSFSGFGKAPAAGGQQQQ